MYNARGTKFTETVRLVGVTSAGEEVDVLVDAAGRLFAETPYTLTNYSTNQTATVIKAAPGFLHSVTINTKGTTASAVSIFDHASSASNPIGVIDSLNLSGTFVYNGNLANGLVITTTGAPNVTVSWR